MKYKKKIALLLGDPSGIGPELVSKLLSEEITNKANIIVIGEKTIFEEGNKISGKYGLTRLSRNISSKFVLIDEDLLLGKFGCQNR